ncbi:MAG: methyltransferase domain-containing protein [Pseudomonadota bacterium]
MAGVEEKVAAHYTTGALYDRVIEALRATGVDPDQAVPADLSGADEFHTAGRLATERLLADIEIGAETRVLDIGAGIGGPARHIADRFGAHVTGIDLTPEFVETAARLSALVGLGERTRFLEGSGTAMPIADGAFDLALLLHVGMNIADKPALLAEVARVLAPGGRFLVFDVMAAAGEGALLFPLPWSSVPETSFVAPPAAYRAAGAAAGLTLLAERDHTEMATAFFAEAFARVAREGPAPLGIHLMMGETAGEKLQNYVANLEAGRIAPTEMVFAKAGDG